MTEGVSSISARSCRLCGVQFKIRESRKKLLNHPELIEELKQINVEFESLSDEDSIHLKCERHIKAIREKDEIRESWVCPVVKKRKRNEHDVIQTERRSTNATDNGLNLKSISEICKEELSTAYTASPKIKDTSVEAITNVDEKELCQELDQLCPLLSTVINGAIGCDDENVKFGTKATVYGILLKARYPRNKPILLAHRNDQLLIAGRTTRRVFKWFNKIGLTNSYSTAITKNKKLAENHDEEVKSWKKKIEKNEENKPEYLLSSDNFDLELRTRHQGINNPNETLHWMNSVAVKDRILQSQDNQPKEYYENFSILPTVQDQVDILDDFKLLVTRSIVKFMPKLQSFQKYIPKHMPHPFTKEMSKKSEVVPLGLIFENENESSGMNTILEHLQKEYVPTYTKEDGETEVLEKIRFSGDQKTEVRADAIIRTMSDGDTKYDRLEGLHPMFADWHLKRTFSEVKESLFNHSNSGSEFGTCRWAMNVLKNTNAKKGPHDAFNAYSEYNDKELDGQILAIAMTYFGMENVDDDPVPTDLEDTKDARIEWLKSAVDSIIEQYVIQYNDEVQRVRQKFEKVNQKAQPELYHCIKVELGECKHQPFQKKGARNNHEKKKHGYDREAAEGNIEDKNKEEEEEDNDPNDYVFDYQKALFTMNLYIRNINDAIREGDGERLMRTYKFVLIYFKATNHHQYCHSLIKLFHQIKLLPDMAFKLIWCRFINTAGYIGRNISLDLHLEHVNGFLKELMKGLRSNVNEKNARRKAHSLNNLMKIVNNIEVVHSIKTTKGHRREPKTAADVKKLAQSYKNAEVFVLKEKRHHDSYPKFEKCILKKLDITGFVNWMKTKETEFKDKYCK